MSWILLAGIIDLYAQFSFIEQSKQFLVACTRLYNPLCLSVGRSVGLSVTLSFFSPFYVILSHFQLLKVILSQFTFGLLVFWSFSLLVF